MTTYTKIDRGNFDEVLKRIVQKRIDEVFDGKVNTCNDFYLERAIGRHYTGKASIPLFFKDKKQGELHVILFLRGDGTGDGSCLTDQIEIPRCYQFDEMPERIGPRNKRDVLLEVCIPLLSIFRNTLAEGVISLEELTLEPTGENGRSRLKREFTLGVDQETYTRIVAGQEKCVESGVFMTTGFTRTGTRFGDPHAIHFPKYYPAASQIVGFLSITHKDNPLAHLIERIAKVPY